MILIEHHDHPRAFFARVRPFLAAREAENNLLLGFESALTTNPRVFSPEPPYLAAAVDDAGGVAGVALRTPPFPLVLSLMDAAAAEAFADALAEEELPGLNAPTTVGAAFLARAGRTAEVAVAERVYEADSVTPPEGVGGRLRHASAADRELLLGWFGAFYAEAMAGSIESDAAAAVDRKLAEPAGGFCVWQDGGAPVSFAGYGSPTPNGIRIGPVYTPPALRRRGYGSAITAAVSEHLLRAGRRFCFLYTDLSNPTSNAIYQRIGYRPVLDVNVWRLAERGAP